MALTNAQRQLALQALIGTSDITSISPIPTGVPMNSLVTGANATALLTALVTAIGTNFDTYLQTTLTSLNGIYNAQLVTAQAQVAAIQAKIAT